MKIPLSHVYQHANPTRRVQKSAVAALAESLTRIGLQTPITVRPVKRMRDGGMADAWEIVAGVHRAEAARQLGWAEIEAVQFDGDETQSRLWEIAENLHRADLTVSERAEMVAEWVRLTGEKPGQVDQVSGGRGNKGGVAQAARELPVSGDTDDAKRKNIERAVKIAALAPEAKEAARETKLDDNQSALLAAAREPTPAAQVTVLREIAERKAVKPAPAPLNDVETEEQWMSAIMRVWNRAAPQWRERFLETVDVPAFDRTRAGAA